MTTIITRSSKRAHRESGVSRDLSLSVNPETTDRGEQTLDDKRRVQRRADELSETRNYSLRTGSSRQHRQTVSLTAPDWSGRTTTLPTVTRTKVTPKPSATRRLVGSRLGSQQQVSQRGRRLSVQKKSEFSKFSFFVISLLSLSVTVAVLLSGMVTQKTFDLKDLARKDAALTNEVETLHRDVQQLQSTADIVKRAGEMEMVVPAQPGVLSVGSDGAARQQLEATADSRPVIDVNALKSGAGSSGSATARNGGSAARNSLSTPSNTDSSRGVGERVEQSSDSASRTQDGTSPMRTDRNTSRNRMNAVPYQDNN